MKTHSWKSGPPVGEAGQIKAECNYKVDVGPDFGDPGRARFEQNPLHVKCRLCRGKLRKREDVEARARGETPDDGRPISDASFLEATKNGLPMARPLTRREERLWAHVIDGVAGIIAGSYEGARLPPPRREEPFANVRHALGALRWAPHGTLPSQSDPDRLERLSSRSWEGNHAAPEPRVHASIDLMHSVRQAWAAAFDGPWISGVDVVPEHIAREIALRRLLERQKLRDIVADLGELPGAAHVTDHTAGRISRWAEDRLYEYLRARELVPLRDDLGGRDHTRKQATEPEQNRGDMALPWDIEGWDNVAPVVGLSVRAAQEAVHEDPPIPVYLYGGRIKALTSELETWAGERMRRNQKKAGNG